MAAGRLSEILGALSTATDMAAGQPFGTGLSATVLAVRVGRLRGLSDNDLSEIYYACITRRIGCTATASEVAQLPLGDERAINHALNLADLADPDSIRLHLERRIDSRGNTGAKQALIGILVDRRERLCHVADAHCTQAVALTRRLPLLEGVPRLLEQVDSRWDGGNPVRLAGDAIPLGTRIIEFAVVAELHRRAGGLESMLDVVRKRSGRQFDPSICALALESGNDLFADFGARPEWDLFVEAEPGRGVEIEPRQFRSVAEAFADFADNKSPWFLGHSRRVSALAFGAATGSGVPEAALQDIFDAGLIHDIGKCAIRNGIWDKAEPLSGFEEAEAETHCFHTEKILAMAGVFASIRRMASSVHERCDGSGYHRGTRLSDRGACLLAAANLYDELIHPQANRPALSRDSAADAMLAEVAAKRLPPDCVRAVLDFAGHEKASATAPPGGLTRREVDVLVRIAKGETNKAIADHLGLSPKTVDKHTENLYRKIDVRSRTAAALYAMENGLLGLED
ncbi:MAG: hypothetical protein KDJ86_13920 [Bauldia sp.]|uniref:HD domain-containing phosphohydrolase n=1 Tax=Bauldia sp. TaxID=2575872 RepID=UPI001DCA08EB|nr:HD domain-containing phosphohydrolase [Bauldia sp.]MCB1496881.1 hypothetical protein [Bauldia sp.]